MTMEEKKELFEKNILGNNLELVIFSLFKHTAGDRCQVTFETLVEVEIKEEYFKDQSLNNLDINNVKTLLGEKTSFSYSKTRNFIAEDEKDNVFEDLKQQIEMHPQNQTREPNTKDQQGCRDPGPGFLDACGNQPPHSDCILRMARGGSKRDLRCVGRNF